MILKKISFMLGKFLTGEIIADYSMLGLKRKRLFEIPRYFNNIRISNFELLVSEIRRREVVGAVAEVGVFQGAFAKYINQAFPDREFYLFDTFEGFNQMDVEIEQKKNFSSGDQDFGNTSVEMVLNLMPYRDKCHIRAGYFPETATGLDNEEFCFVSLDADLYKPILDGLKFFYPKLKSGGYIMIHDFNNDHYAGARKAVEEFCDLHQIPFIPITDPWGTVIIGK